MVSNVPLPTPGKDRVLFAIDNCLLSVEAPPKEGLPHADVLELLQIWSFFYYSRINIYDNYNFSPGADIFSTSDAMLGC